jgi:hypothetical protein
MGKMVMGYEKLFRPFLATDFSTKPLLLGGGPRMLSGGFWNDEKKI